MRIVAEGLACVRGGREVFRDLQFTVQAGEMLAVTGPNGAGKSSLLRVVAGLVRQSEGRLVLDGGDAELSIGEQAHYVGHLDALKPSLSVQENLAFWTDFRGGEGEVADSLVRVGLNALGRLPARYLSAGQRRRLSLARLLAVERPIWLLDEPASTLDTAGQELLADMMATHLSRAGLILAAIHGPLPQTAKELRLAGAAAWRRIGLDTSKETWA